MASPKVRIDFMPSWFEKGQNVEAAIGELLSSLGVDVEETNAIRYPDTGAYKGEMYITLPEGADERTAAEKINGQEIIEGHKLLARPATFKPRAEGTVAADDTQPTEGGLPRM